MRFHNNKNDRRIRPSQQPHAQKNTTPKTVNAAHIATCRSTLMVSTSIADESAWAPDIIAIKKHPNEKKSSTAQSSLFRLCTGEGRMKRRVKGWSSPSGPLSRLIPNGSPASGSSPNVRGSGRVNGRRGKIGKGECK